MTPLIPHLGLPALPSPATSSPGVSVPVEAQAQPGEAAQAAGEHSPGSHHPPSYPRLMRDAKSDHTGPNQPTRACRPTPTGRCQMRRLRPSYHTVKGQQYRLHAEKGLRITKPGSSFVPGIRARSSAEGSRPCTEIALSRHHRSHAPFQVGSASRREEASSPESTGKHAGWLDRRDSEHSSVALLSAS